MANNYSFFSKTMDLQVNESAFKKTIQKNKRQPAFIMKDGRGYMSTHCFRHPNIAEKNIDTIKLRVVEREKDGVKMKFATCPKCYIFFEIK